MPNGDSTLDAYEIARARALLDTPTRRRMSLRHVLAAGLFVAVSMLVLAFTLLAQLPT
jgi:hypothetical protein